MTDTIDRCANVGLPARASARFDCFFRASPSTQASWTTVPRLDRFGGR